MDPFPSVTSASTFSVCGDAQVFDKTGGIAKVVFLNIQDKKGRNQFQITVAGKILTFPTCNDPKNSGNMIWSGCKTFTFEKVQGSFLKIHEKDDTGHTESVFVDLEKSESYCDVYKSLPKEITYAEALKKIEEIDTQKIRLLFNRHGTALIAYEREYVVYFAFPNEDKAKKIELYFNQVLRNGDFSLKSKDCFINLRNRLDYDFPRINDENAFYVHFRDNQPGELIKDAAIALEDDPPHIRARVLEYLKQIRP